jgi:predicted metal-dependent hydrolase
MAPAPDTLTIDGLLFAVRWSHRRRTIGIGIPSQGPPTLAAPAGCRRATIEAAVQSKLPWVRRKLAEREARPQLAPPERRYETGESFPYLGGHYELVVVDDGPAAVRAPAGRAAGATRSAGADQSAGAEQSASADQSAGADVQLEFDEPRGAGRKRPARARPRLRLRNGRFELTRAAQVEGRAVFLAWYRRRATEVLKERIAYYAPLVGVAPPPITIKDMHSRWGSCSAKGRVNLYWGLVALPLELADYVVVHELAHLLELNHSPAFWRGVERVLPDYRERRKRLRSEGPRSVI